MTEGGTGTHNLAMPRCASTDWAHTAQYSIVYHILPDVQLNLAMPHLASNDQGPALAFSFWPCLAVQVMTEGQHR